MSTSKDASLFWLTPVQAAITAHEDGPDASPFWMLGSCAALVEGTRKVPDLAHCFKSGLGLKYDECGEGMGCGVCRELSVWTRHNLLSHVAKIKGATLFVLDSDRSAAWSVRRMFSTICGLRSSVSCRKPARS